MENRCSRGQRAGDQTLARVGSWIMEKVETFKFFKTKAGRKEQDYHSDGKTIAIHGGGGAHYLQSSQSPTSVRVSKGSKLNDPQGSVICTVCKHKNPVSAQKCQLCERAFRHENSEMSFNPECITLDDECEESRRKRSLHADEIIASEKSEQIDVTQSKADDDMPLLHNESEGAKSSTKPQDFNLDKASAVNVDELYFGSYKSAAKSAWVNQDVFKLLSVVPYSEDVKFKFNITIPTIEIEKLVYCFNDECSVVLICTVPDSVTKISKAIGLDNASCVHKYDPSSKETTDRYIVVILRDQTHRETIENLAHKVKKIKEIDALVAAHFIRELKERSEEKCNANVILETVSQNGANIRVTEINLASSDVDRNIGRQESRNFVNIEELKRPPIKRDTSEERVGALTRSYSSVIELDDNQPSHNQNDLNDNEMILCYPPNEKDAITIYKEDLSCLAEDEFLNDTILGFYLKYIYRQQTPADMKEKTHLFSTFFYSKLVNRRKGDNLLTVQQRYHDRVKNWTRGFDIFSKDFIVMPLNKDYHWFLAIVCYPSNVPDASQSDIENKEDGNDSFDSLDDADASDVSSTSQVKCNEKSSIKRSPCIIYMDSLGGVKAKFRMSEPIRHYLTLEWKLKKGTTKVFNKSTIPDYFPMVPRQTNSSDCGLYVLQYVESFLKDPYQFLSKFPLRDHSRWFPQKLIYTKREEIRDLIIAMSSNIISDSSKSAESEKHIENDERIETDQNRKEAAESNEDIAMEIQSADLRCDPIVSEKVQSPEEPMDCSDNAKPETVEESVVVAVSPKRKLSTSDTEDEGSGILRSLASITAECNNRTNSEVKENVCEKKPKRGKLQSFDFLNTKM